MKALKLTEDQRRTVATGLVHIGWWGALGLTITDIAIVQADPAGRAARSMGIIIVLLIGVAIAASSARSRMRLADTIAAVFETGMQAAGSEPRRTCVMEADLEGVIQWVENADVIGWSRNALLGHKIVDLMPERFRPVHDSNVAALMASDNGREIGPTLTLSMLSQDGQEIVVQKVLSRIGHETLMATISAVPTADDMPAQRMGAAARAWRPNVSA